MQPESEKGAVFRVAVEAQSLHELGANRQPLAWAGRLLCHPGVRRGGTLERRGSSNESDRVGLAANSLPAACPDGGRSPDGVKIARHRSKAPRTGEFSVRPFGPARLSTTPAEHQGSLQTTEPNVVVLRRGPGRTPDDPGRKICLPG